MTTPYVFRFLALAVFLGASLAQATPSSADAKLLLDKILATKANIADIEFEQRNTTTDLNAKMRAASECIILLNREPMTEERIREMQSNLNVAKARVVSLEQQLEVAQISDPADRQMKLEEMKQSSSDLKEELKTALLPFAERIKEAHKPIEEITVAWVSTLGDYFRTPSSGPYAGLTKSEIRWQTNDTGQLSWKDSNGKQVCWVSIFLQASPEKAASKQAKLYDKYPTTFMKVKNVWVSCGNLKLAMNVDKAEWSTDETAVSELFKALVDMDGINRFSPQPDL